MNASWCRAASASAASEGKIAAVTFAREKRAAVPRHLLRHAARLHRGRAHVVGLNGASSTEFGPRAAPIVGLMTEWEGGRQRRAARATISAARCGWAPIPACSSRAAAAATSTAARGRSASGTGTATR